MRSGMRRPDVARKEVSVLFGTHPPPLVEDVELVEDLALLVQGELRCLTNYRE
jgi:hypothetical protein